MQLDLYPRGFSNDIGSVVIEQLDLYPRGFSNDIGSAVIEILIYLIDFLFFLWLLMCGISQIF